MPQYPRTDLAVEAHTLHTRDAALEGVTAEEYDRDGFHVSVVEVTSEDAARKLCKPIGRYHTVSVEPVLRREDASFSNAVSLLAEQIRGLLPLADNATVFVVGLGNRAITPDAVGPLAVEQVLATRHLPREQFGFFRPVSALAPGVLGMTGIESAALVQALAGAVHADAIIAIDALACAEHQRLCRTIQITDTGITPGSGVGNDRAALNRESLGVPVLALGVPTVMDAGILSEHADISGLFITPRDIDTVVRDFAKLAGYAIDLALHPDLTLADLDILLS